MMPLIKGESEDQEPRPAGKIRHHLLFTAALTMSLFLLSTALITTLLIPAASRPNWLTDAHWPISHISSSATDSARSMIFRRLPFCGSADRGAWKAFSCRERGTFSSLARDSSS